MGNSASAELVYGFTLTESSVVKLDVDTADALWGLLGGPTHIEVRTLGASAYDSQGLEDGVVVFMAEPRIYAEPYSPTFLPKSLPGYASFMFADVEAKLSSLGVEVGQIGWLLLADYG